MGKQQRCVSCSHCAPAAVHPQPLCTWRSLGHPGRERLRLCSFIVVQAGERKHSELHTGSHSFHLKATHGFAAGHVTTRNSREGKKCNRSCTQTLKGWDSPAKSNNDHCRRAGHSPWARSHYPKRPVLSHALVCSAGCTVFFFFFWKTAGFAFYLLCWKKERGIGFPTLSRPSHDISCVIP